MNFGLKIFPCVSLRNEDSLLHNFCTIMQFRKFDINIVLLLRHGLYVHFTKCPNAVCNNTVSLDENPVQDDTLQLVVKSLLSPLIRNGASAFLCLLQNWVCFFFFLQRKDQLFSRISLNLSLSGSFLTIRLRLHVVGRNTTFVML